MSRKPAIDAQSLTQLIKDSPSGVIRRSVINARWRDVSHAIKQAKRHDRIATFNNFLYDPARLTREEAIKIHSQNGQSGLPDFLGIIHDTLKHSDAKALIAADLEQCVGSYFQMDVLEDAELDAIGIGLVELKLYRPFDAWYYLKDITDYETAYDYALTEAEKLHLGAWEQVLEWAGNELRVGANEGNNPRTRALARLYSRSQAASFLDMTERVFRFAIRQGYLPRFDCPDGAKRIPAFEVHKLQMNSDLRRELEDAIEINIWQIRQVTDLKISYVRTLLHNNHVHPTRTPNNDGDNARVWYQWGDVRKVLWPQNDHPSMSDLEMIEDTGGAGRQAWWSDFIIQIHEDIEQKKREQREARDRRRRDRREKRDALRNQMIDNFPSWLREEEIEQTAFIHVGPTNSGKTHDALIELGQAGSGWYLAPLRLLAREMFDKLNREGVLCNLLTGEERIDVPGAKITAATVEMFNADISGECVVIDEAHMVGDQQRGWAWTQALVNARAPILHIITAPHGLSLLSKILDNVGIETQIMYHDRLVPLDVASEPWSLAELPPRTILIAFSRRDVLRLKYLLQEKGRTAAVVYGALPPEVRLRQAQRFADGDAEICVATDAVGMGLNLPADNVVFSTVTKFDGYRERKLYASEVQQIGGRAGRYGLSERGVVNGLDHDLLNHVKKNLYRHVPDIDVARVAPRTDEIELLEGDLTQRLTTWKQLNAIPEALKDLVRSTELDDKIELAQFLSYEDLMTLGVDSALTLVTAPVRRESQEYWVECATSVLQNEPLPLPPPAPTDITEGQALKIAETVIACMDVYLWLGYRRQFQHLVSDVESILELREHLTAEMDLALMRRFDPTVRRASNRRRRSYFYDDF